MVFASDRDVWVIEPRVFDEVAWAAQRRVTGAEVVVGGDGITLASATVNFEQAGIGAGAVVELVGSVGRVEVVGRPTASSLTISKLRDDPDGPPLRVFPGAWTGTLNAATFGPQIAAVHAMVLSALGLRAGEPPVEGAAEGVVYESAVLNRRELAQVEALGALRMIYLGAASLSGGASVLWDKAQRYGELFDAARRETPALIDADGDGVAEAQRRINRVRTAMLVRA